MSPEEPEAGARRVAVNSVIQAGGEAGSKVAMLVLYAVMARELGTGDFGEFTSAASFALLVTIAAFGMDYTVTRLIATHEGSASDAFWNACVAKLVLGGIGVVAVLGVAALGGYGSEVVVATGLLGVAALVDLLTLSLQAVFRGIERTGPIAQGQLLQRFGIAIVAGAALMSGSGLTTVCAIWLGGSVVALGFAAWRVRGAGLARRGDVSLAGIRSVVSDSLGLGVSAAFGGALSRLDVIILGLLQPSAAVALYGAAYRLFESTFFLTTTFALASFPMVSRLSRTSTPTIARAYGQIVKVVAVITLPLGILFALEAEPLARLVYGAEYADAASVIRLLGPSVALIGLFTVTCNVLAAQERQRDVLLGLGAGAIVNAALNLALIPSHGADGAAAAMSGSMLVTDAALVAVTLRATGPIAPVRLLAGPVVAAVVMAGLGLIAGPGLPLAPLLGIAYLCVLALVERRVSPGDVELLLRLVRRRPAPGVPA